MTEAIGYLAAFLTTVSFFPQVWKTWRSKSAHDLSAIMLTMFTVGVFLWLVYGMQRRAAPIVMANAATLAQATFLLVLRLRYGRPEQPE